MKKFEYTREILNGAVALEQMNAMGQQGWELVYYNSVQHMNKWTC